MKPTNIYHILHRLTTKKLSSSQRDIIRYWLIDKNDVEEKDAALKRIWDETEAPITESIDASLAQTYLKIESAKRSSLKISLIKRSLRYAAILMLPLISALCVWFVMNNNQPTSTEMITCYVPNGQQRTINLADNSTVQLNAGTLFIYPKEFSKKERTVYLVGEANFSVANDVDKPFIVNAKTLKVHVLGTKFNVESYSEDEHITVTLEKGAVKVYESDNFAAAKLMRPNEQLKYSQKDKSFRMAPVDASYFSEWTSGGLFFDHKSLRDILASVERHYNVHFLIDSEIENSDQYTMRIKSHETIEDVLHVFIQIAGNNINYKRQGQIISLFPKRKEVNL